MTVPLDSTLTVDPEFLADSLRERRPRAIDALPLAKSIVDAAEAEAQRLVEEAKRQADALAHNASQEGFVEGLNRAAGQIFTAAELEHRSAASVIKHALPIICEALAKEFGVSHRVAALASAMGEALREKRLTPPYTIAVAKTGVAAVTRVLKRQAVSPQEARIEIDDKLAPGFCVLSNSAGSIEIDVAAHLEGFLRRLARHQELRDALIDDLVRCLERER